MSRYATSYYDWQGGDEYYIAIAITHFYGCAMSAKNSEEVKQVM